jgi:hypothetical protein
VIARTTSGSAPSGWGSAPVTTKSTTPSE